MNYLAKTLALPLITLIPTVGLADWNGPYVGGAIGTVNAEADFELATTPSTTFDFDDSLGFGAFAGMLIQSGDLVYGGEVALTVAPNAEISDGEELTPFTDIKGRVGYSFGDILAYGVAGITFANYDENGEDFDGTGFNFGAGVDYMINDQIFVGAEYLARRTSGDYPNDDAEFDLDIDTLSIRAGFNF